MGKHKQHRCSTCGGSGHNTATCPATASIRAMHGNAADEELVVIVTKITYPDDTTTGPIAHCLHENQGFLRVYLRGALDPRVTAVGKVPYFQHLAEVARHLKEEAVKDGRGESCHRPVALSLVGARRAFPGALFGEPHTEYA